MTIIIKYDNIYNIFSEGKLDTASLIHALRSKPDLVTLEWIFELVKNEVLRYVFFGSRTILRQHYIAISPKPYPNPNPNP